jgi:glyoxylase I family protein
MSTMIKSGVVHHLALTVKDVVRSRDFYQRYLGFHPVMDWGPRVLLSNGSMVLALTPPSNPAQALPNDRFNENRIGLDHLSFNIESRSAMEAAAQTLDEGGIERGEIKDLGPELGIYVMAIRDPDNIQIELTTPYQA